MSKENPIDGTCDPRFESVREVFSQRIQDGHEVGAAIAFTLNGESVVDLWGGHTDKAKTQPWEQDTLVNTYSTTKGMTAICAHRLVEQGRLDLDAPVTKYWPEFGQAGKEAIPVSWLLSHQGGIPAIRKSMPEGSLYDWGAMCDGLAESEPWWTPGTKHGYHPVTFGHLVGEVLRRIDGRSVGQMFREDVAEPLQADFHIGLDAKHDARTSDMIGGLVPDQDKKKDGEKSAGPKPTGAMADFMRDMTDPTTMVGSAFNNPPIRTGAVNSREWRAAEIPAANGHGTARALARIYGALSIGGEVDGVRILEADSIVRARTEQCSGPDATLAGMPMRYGLGFMLQSPFMPLSPSTNAFGHPGAGGSIGMADPDAGVGFGFTMNKMGVGLVGGATGFAVLKAFFKSL